MEFYDKFYDVNTQEEKRYSIENPSFKLDSFNNEKDELKENYILFKKDKKFNTQ